MRRIDFVAMKKSVSRYELQTRLAVMQSKKATEFMGWVTYELKDEGNQWNKVTHMLARHAEYANVGRNKTAVYGQTTPIKAKSVWKFEKRRVIRCLIVETY